MTQSSTESRVTVQMFIGCLIGSELRMHLKYSESWQQKQVLPTRGGEDLRQLRYESKEYVGMLLKRGFVTLDDLRDLEAQVREAIVTHCPELEVGKMDVCIFPQLFLS